MFKNLQLSWSQLKTDMSFSALVAGFIVVLVGMTSSAVLVFQAATAAGVGPREASSWMGSLCISVGLLGLVFSLKYRTPVLFAWSTAGAALLASSLSAFNVNQAIGAFLVSAVLVFICGVTGIFEKILSRIPLTLAAALLAGVLMNFALNTFLAVKTQPLLIGIMFVSYLVGRKYAQRSTMLIVLIASVLVASFSGLFEFEKIKLTWTEFYFTAPTFDLQSLLSLALPLFIVTMASQNLTGISVMRSHNYDTPVSTLMSWSGFVNILIATLGGFSISLAAITAAIAMGPECHSSPQKRYVAGVFAGLLYVIVGIFAGTVTSIFAAFPAEMVMGIAGLALLSTIAASLQKALSVDSEKEAAFITFVITASGLSLFGVGSAFWGICGGAVTLAFLRWGTSRTA